MNSNAATKRTAYEWLRLLVRPTRWFALVIYAAGGVAMLMNVSTLWADAWLHRQPNAFWAIIGLGGAMVCNAMGARLYYLAKDLPEIERLRDEMVSLGERAQEVQAAAEAFLKPIAEARGRGADVVGVVLREGIVIMDDPDEGPPSRVIN